MAKSENNVLTHGLSGKMGDLIVFRQRAGKTIVSNKPKASDMPPSEGQMLIRERFSDAVRYGKAVITDPVSKAAYSAAAPRGTSAYNMAVKDFFNAPDIGEVIVSSYNGHVGDKVTARVTDDFLVKSVTVRIENADATLVEEGAAVMAVNGLDWVYTAKSANSSLTGDKIIIIAKDTPDNTSKKEVTLN
jgi:hypothetical protein